MGKKRSGIEYKNWKIYAEVLLGFILICAAQTSFSVTTPADGKYYVYVLNLCICLSRGYREFLAM